MAILVLVRHGRTAANAEGILAGWTPGVVLDDKGIEQAARVARRLSASALAAVVSSPLERCQQTAAAIVEGQSTRSRTNAAQDPLLHTDEQLGECHYGSWTGRPLKELSREALWQDIQQHPSTVTFPPHDDFRAESMLGMQERAVRAITRWDARIEAAHGPGAVWAAISHGDVIKALVAHALASPLDHFQRITIDPASVSIVRQAVERPFVLRVNDTGSDPVDLESLSRSLTEAAERHDGSGDDAALGGGAGSD